MNKEHFQKVDKSVFFHFIMISLKHNVFHLFKNYLMKTMKVHLKTYYG